MDSTIGGTLLPGIYDPGLVILSILVAIFSATMSLQTAYIARHTNQKWHRLVAIATGAVALGGGIWTMHFIGMLAFELCTPVTYHLGLTALSVVPALIASGVALHMLSKAEVNNVQLLYGGILVGAGVGTMHYSGMAAMRMSAVLRYDPLYFSLSIVVAIVLATISLGVRFKLHRLKMRRMTRLILSGSIMGLAIAGMHYTGMSAARFIGEPDSHQGLIIINSTFASLALSTFTVTVTVLVTAANGLVRYRQTFRQMRESESRIRAIVETAVDGIIIIDSKGIVRDMNRSAERLFGWLSDEVVGNNIKMLMPEPDRSGHDGYLHNFLSSNEAKIIGQGREVTALHKSGYEIPIRLAVGQVDLPGAPMFVGFLTDISERRLLEASLRESVEKAEQAAAAKTTFLANMSHEIRTPMNAIIGFSELLLETDLAPLQRSHLSIVHQSARSLLGLLNDVLDTTKLEKGAVTLERIDFSLFDLAQQIVSSLRLSAQRKQLLLTLDYQQGMARFFKGDPLRIQQVITNILGNAIKFTQQGQVAFRIFTRNGLVLLEISDTGIGMSEEQLSRIFKPFSQADASISRRFGGTGLGTSIARQLTELMGGSITVESVLRQGSVFLISLPLAEGQEPRSKTAKLDDAHLPKMKVLIADDVPQNLELLTHLLHAAGHEVMTASDGDAAVSCYAQEGDFDLILMDVHMPHVDGLDAARRIRILESERSTGKHVPIIALTASVMQADQLAAKSAGMNGFVTKPIDVPRLRAEIARVLNIEVDVSPESASSHTPSDALDIDWQAGLAVWGDKSKMVKAIQAFLSEQKHRHPLPNAAGSLASTNWPRAKQSLHGIRGAAANLYLMRISSLSALLEKRAGKPDQGLLADVAQLEALITATHASLASIDIEAGTPGRVISLEDGHMVLSEMRGIAASLRELFLHSEIDETALRRLGDALHLLERDDMAQVLTRAIDNFDFEGAIVQINQIEEFLAKRSEISKES